MPFPSSSGGSGSGTTLTSGTITQTAHALVVGNIIRFDGTNYVKAQANNAVNSEAIGIVTSVIDANNFTFSQSGLITGLTGLTAGQVYFLSDITAGLLTATEPTAVSSVSKPLFEAVSAASGYYTNMRGNPALGQTAVVGYGENTTITNLTTFGTTLTDIAGSSFTIPSAGTWEVTYNIFGSHPSVANGTIAIYNASNVIVPNSTGNIAAFGNGLVNVEVTNKVFIITTGAATYQLKGQTAAGTMTVYNTSTLGVNNSGNSKITWLQIGASPVPMDLIGENGIVSVPTSSTSTASVTTLTDLANASVTIPSAGVWDLTFTANAFLDTLEQINGVWTDSNNIEVGSAVRLINSNLAVSSMPLIITARVTTSSPTIYKIRVGTNVLAVQYPVFNPGTIHYRKISGFIPSSGQTVDFINVRKTTNTTVSGGADIIFDNVISGNIPYNTTTGLFTLTVGKTYEITTMLRQAASLSACDYSLVDSTNAILPNSPQGSSNANTSQGDVSISFVYTPTTNIQIKLRNIAGAGTFGGNQQWVTIKQIGTSAVIAGVYPGTWTNYTPIITGTTSNPTIPTSGAITGSYTVNGKMLNLNIKYFGSLVAGGNAGSGSYIFSLPPGYVIDTTKANIPTTFTQTAGDGIDGGVVGSASSRNAGATAFGWATPLTTTGIGIFDQSTAKLIGSATISLTGNSNTTYAISAQIPIL